jgi:hypothetical protein
MPAPHRIDVHHHILPPRYVEAVGEAAIGQLLVSGKAPKWTPEIAIEVMDRHGIEKAYTSMSAPGVSGFPEAETASIVRSFNDDAANIRRITAGVSARSPSFRSPTWSNRSRKYRAFSTRRAPTASAC